MPIFDTESEKMFYIKVVEIFVSFPEGDGLHSDDFQTVRYARFTELLLLHLARKLQNVYLTFVLYHVLSIWHHYDQYQLSFRSWNCKAHVKHICCRWLTLGGLLVGEIHHLQSTTTCDNGADVHVADTTPATNGTEYAK